MPAAAGDADQTDARKSSKSEEEDGDATAKLPPELAAMFFSDSKDEEFDGFS